MYPTQNKSAIRNCDGASIVFRGKYLYCSRFQLIISPSVVVELETGAL
jgi:hypothetical protein